MLRAIELTNFKCFASVHLDLSPLTLLTGLNAAGKSTILQALMVLRQSALQNMLPDKGLLLNGATTSLGTAQAVLYEGASEDVVRIVLVTEDTRAEWAFGYGGPEDDFLAVAGDPVHLPSTALFTDRLQYLVAERLGPRSMYETSTYEVAQHGQIGQDGRYAVAFLDRYRASPTPQELWHPHAIDATLLSQVTAWLGEVAPGVQLRPNPLVGIQRIALNVGFVAERTRSQEFRPPNVGFGLSYALPVLVALLGSGSDSLVLIENPEAHLHPKGQVAMGELLARASAAGIQVIVETHSDHLLNGVRLAVKSRKQQGKAVGIHFFSRRAREGRFVHNVDSPRLNDQGRIDRWPEGFFDEWERSLDGLLDS